MGPTFFSKLEEGFKLENYELFLVRKKSRSWKIQNECVSSFEKPTVVSVAVVALQQLLTELEDFLRILDKENLSSTALVKKSFLSDLLRVYTKSSGMGKGNRGQGGGVPWELLQGLEATFSWRLVGRGDMKIRRRK